MSRKVTGPSPGWAAAAARMAVLRPIGRSPDHTTWPAMAFHTRERWQARMACLREAGWDGVSSRKAEFAASCPPCGMTLSGRKGQPCKLRGCPFCYGRTVEDLLAAALRMLEKAQAAGPHYLYLYASTRGTKKDAPDRIWLEHGRLLTDFGEHYLANHLRLRDAFRTKVVAKGVGGAYLISPAPRLFFPKLVGPHEARQNKALAADGAVGTWQVRHVGFAVLPAEVPPPVVKSGRGRYIKLPEPAETMTALATIFRYPRFWLTGHAFLTAQMFNGLHGQRLLTKFGDMRGNHAD